MHFTTLEPTEHQSQRTLIDWVDKTAATTDPLLSLLYAIPNGAKLQAGRKQDGTRFSREAAKLIAEGMRSGMPDLCLPVARSGWSALYIEMKTREGRISDAQQKKIPQLVEAGNCVLLARRWEFAAEYLLAYLKGHNGAKRWALVPDGGTRCEVTSRKLTYWRTVEGLRLELFDPYTWVCTETFDHV